jgi:hypothetical protein
MPEREPFYQQVDQWFEPLSVFGTQPSPLKDQIAELANAAIPNRRRLEKMIPLLEQLPADLKTLLVPQANAIIAGEYSRGSKKSFKYAYNRISRWQGQCSATSELFSQIRQAITYNDKTPA